MIRGLFYKFNRSFKNLQNAIFHVKLLSPTLISQPNMKQIKYFMDQNLSWLIKNRKQFQIGDQRFYFHVTLYRRLR